jgi:hypothetical protein
MTTIQPTLNGLIKGLITSPLKRNTDKVYKKSSNMVPAQARVMNDHFLYNRVHHTTVTYIEYHSGKQSYLTGKKVYRESTWWGKGHLSSTYGNPL